MRHSLPLSITGTISAAGVGAADGFVAAKDALAGRTKAYGSFKTMQRATMLQGGSFLVGAIAPRFGLSRSIADPMVTTSVALALRQVAFKMVAPSTTPPFSGGPRRAGGAPGMEVIEPGAGILRPGIPVPGQVYPQPPRRALAY